MFKSNTLALRLSVALAVTAAVIMSLLLPLLTASRSNLVQAAQVSSRSITMGTSAPNATTSYVIAFTVPNNGAENIGSFRVEFCNNNPLSGTTCTNTAVGDDVPFLDNVTFTSGTFDDTGGTDECTVSMEAITAGDRYIDFACSAADDITNVGNFTATVNLVDNPDNSTAGGADNNTFYARLYTYAALTPTAIANPVTGFNNEGGVALSTAEQITVQARVQENLTFEVFTGPDDATDCDGAATGTAIDLGVVDFTGDASSGGNENRATLDPVGGNTNGICVRVSTNAGGGVTIGYIASEFKVSGATCSEDDIDLTASSTDKCWNWDNDAPNAIDDGIEQWGIQVLTLMQQGDGLGGSTSNLAILSADYDATTPDDVFTIDGNSTTVTAISDSSASTDKVVDTEALLIDVGAVSAATTPTGLYAATITFVATSTF